MVQRRRNQQQALYDLFLAMFVDFEIMMMQSSPKKNVQHQPALLLLGSRVGKPLTKQASKR